jgi:hypothetical protein
MNKRGWRLVPSLAIIALFLGPSARAWEDPWRGYQVGQNVYVLPYYGAHDLLAHGFGRRYEESRTWYSDESDLAEAARNPSVSPCMIHGPYKPLTKTADISAQIEIKSRWSRNDDAIPLFTIDIVGNGGRDVYAVQRVRAEDLVFDGWKRFGVIAYVVPQGTNYEVRVCLDRRATYERSVPTGRMRCVGGGREGKECYEIYEERSFHFLEWLEVSGFIISENSGEP